MADFEELVAQAAEGSYDPGQQVPTVLVGAAELTEGAEGVVGGLVGYFGEDDERQGVRLVVAGRAAGYLHRSDLYAFVGSIRRGYGSSDVFFPPGPTRPVLRTACCPVDGVEFMVTRFDPDHPPTCPDHDEPLELVE
jgi:hypothetical protein